MGDKINSIMPNVFFFFGIVLKYTLMQEESWKMGVDMDCALWPLSTGPAPHHCRHLAALSIFKSWLGLSLFIAYHLLNETNESVRSKSMTRAPDNSITPELFSLFFATAIISLSALVRLVLCLSSFLTFLWRRIHLSNESGNIFQSSASLPLSLSL